MMNESLSLGSIFDERFEIRAVAGRGGMGTVYRAWHMNLQREVALKVLNTSAISTPEQLKRFQQEARVAFSLKHPNISGVDSFGTCDSLSYVAFEFLDGRTLADIVETCQPISFERFVSLFSQICDGLHYAHEHGVLHRDLKPANIFVIHERTENETAKIVDFGIAKILPGAGADHQKLTATGHILGTPLYMSPEQCRAEKLDARSDIYAVGCLMYYCVAGKPPFEAASAFELLLAHQSAVPPDVVLPDGYPKSVWSIIMRCMEKQPSDRYASAADVQRDLKLCLDGKTIAPAVRKVNPPGKKLSIAKPLLIGLTAAAAILAIPAFDFYKNTRMKDAAAQGDFSQLSAAMKDACARHDYATASRLFNDNKESLFNFPSVAAAEVCLLAAENKVTGSKSDTDKFFDPTWRILRAMPETEWSKPSAMDALRNVRGRHNGKDATSDAGGAVDESASMFAGVWAPILRNQGSPVAEELVCREALNIANGLPTCSPRLLQALWRAGYSLLSDGHVQIAREIAQFCVQHTATTDGYKRVPSEAQLADVYAAEGSETQCRELLESVAQRIEKQNIPETERCSILFRLAATYAVAGDKKRAAEVFAQMERLMKTAPSEDAMLRYAGPVASGLLSTGDSVGAKKLLAAAQPRAAAYLRREPNADSRISATHAFASLLLGPEAAGVAEMFDFQKRKDRKSPANYRVLDTWADMVAHEAGVADGFNLFPSTGGESAKRECLNAISEAAFYRSAWRPRKAVECMEKALAIIESQHCEPLTDKLVSHVRMHTAQTAALVPNDPAFVDKEFCKAIAVKPSEPDVMAVVLTQWAQLQRERGQLDTAAATIEKALALEDNHSKTRAVSEACAIYARQGQWDLVSELGEKVEDNQLKRPERTEWLRRWAEPYTMALRKQGKSAKADRVIETVERKIQHSARPTTDS